MLLRILSHTPTDPQPLAALLYISICKPKLVKGGLTPKLMFLGRRTSSVTLGFWQMGSEVAICLLLVSQHTSGHNEEC